MDVYSCHGCKADTAEEAIFAGFGAGEGTRTPESQRLTGLLVLFKSFALRVRSRGQRDSRSATPALFRFSYARLLALSDSLKGHWSSSYAQLDRGSAHTFTLNINSRCINTIKSELDLMKGRIHGRQKESKSYNES